jgi:hypothetical protein
MPRHLYHVLRTTTGRRIFPHSGRFAGRKSINVRRSLPRALTSRANPHAFPAHQRESSGLHPCPRVSGLQCYLRQVGRQYTSHSTTMERRSGWCSGSGHRATHESCVLRRKREREREPARYIQVHDVTGFCLLSRGLLSLRLRRSDVNVCFFCSDIFN